ncbi:MAG: hypothetical protein Q7R95_07215, partial [bacterium]|nr:hypothetical protein [bacterium]
MRKLTLVLGDIAILYVSLYITLLIRYQSGFTDRLNDHVYPFTIIFALWLLVFYIANIYDLTIAKNNLFFYRVLSYAMGINGVFAIAAFYLIHSFTITPKTNFFIFFGLSIILLFT